MRRVLAILQSPDAFASLRAGSWLTHERLRIYPALLGGALALTLVGLVLTSHGVLDHWQRPLGVDFSGVWVAGEAVRAGHPAQPYDNVAHAAAQAAAFGPSDSYLPWPYPPYFLTVAALLACLPYLAALALWQSGTLLLYLAAILQAVRRSGLARRDILLAGLAFPAIAVNIFHGQNGCLSAGLVAIGGFLLPRRPLIAGLMLGLLAYKPQFALAVPLAVAAGGYWRAGLSATLTVATMTLVTWLIFGDAPWQGFAASLAFTRRIILEGGGLESWKLQSAFAAVRLLGGPLALAYAVQGAVTIVVLAVLAVLWRSATDHRLKVAALATASLLASPYVVDYDIVVLGPALAALWAVGWERGFLPWEKTVLALAWAMPLAARGASLALYLPLGLVTMLVLYAFIARRAGWPQRDDRPSNVAAAMVGLC